MTRPALFDIPLTRIDGTAASLAEHAGKVLLVVNVASKCGLTVQYAGLQALWRGWRDRGLVVLGFPANDFKGQEPGSDAEIAAFCEGEYGVDFPMFAKIEVTGPGRHPLYRALTEARPEAWFPAGSTMRQRLPETAPGAVLWNFEKFLIGRDGAVVGRFGPDTLPEEPALVAAIEGALAAPAEVPA
jgi:glutathione peroxidase